jgi:predicted DNA-binding transcriptional regulator AlpA
MDNREHGVNTLLCEQEVAGILRLSITTLWRWRRDNSGPKFQRIGRLIRYRQEDVQSWIDSLSGGGE